MNQELKIVDYIGIGCGIAGATAATQYARLNPDAKVLLLTRTSDPKEANTYFVQGGMNLKGGQKLIEDTLKAGDGICLPAAVELLASEGPRKAREILIEQAGVIFDKDAHGNLAFNLEGGASEARVARVDGATGKELQTKMLELVARYSNIELATNLTAVDLLTLKHHSRDPLRDFNPNACVGIYAYDQKDNHVSRILSKQGVVIATGGASQIFAYSTNPPGARGDGMAIAYRAKAELTGMEYEQFHPTALKLQGAPPFLISEAVRGAGAVLVDAKGHPFMQDYYPDLKNPNLATRDKVSRAIFNEMLKSGEPNMYLDATHLSNEVIKIEFEAIYKQLLKYGIDMTTTPIPIAPAAHYTVGGIQADLYGRTNIRNLFAVGEAGNNGVDGANRLASNSTLNGLLSGARAASALTETGDSPPAWKNPEEIMPWKDYGQYSPDPAIIAADMTTIKNDMWNMVGLVRKTPNLERALRDLTRLNSEITQFYFNAILSDELLGLRNMIAVSLLVAQKAYANPVSRGGHWRE